MTDYSRSNRIAEINDIEKELDERMPNMPEDDFNAMRGELRRLTLMCFDDALCNYLDRKYPGAVSVEELTEVSMR